jgi:hypothetical protein
LMLYEFFMKSGNISDALVIQKMIEINNQYRNSIEDEIIRRVETISHKKFLDKLKRDDLAQAMIFMRYCVETGRLSQTRVEKLFHRHLKNISSGKDRKEKTGKLAKIKKSLINAAFLYGETLLADWKEFSKGY